uniref:Protein takeout n=1 Tax=Cacopsylla melanoneura TaxID=428564 RepID=A0A8D9EY51_9HEMI
MVTRAFVRSLVRLILCGSLLMMLEPVGCAKKWPDWVKPCRKSDGPPDDCILKRITEALPHVVNGYPKAYIPKLDPLAIKSLSVSTGNKQVGLSLTLNDCLFYGTKITEFYKVHHDFEKKHCDFYWRVPKLTILGQYKMDGKVLLVPIHGKGDGNITLTDVLSEMGLDYELVPKKGLHYARSINSNMTFSVGRAYFDLKNLFDGDKYLGAQMNAFLNENNADVIQEFGPAVGDAFNKVFRSIIQIILDLVALETIYPDIEIDPNKQHVD